MRQRDQASTLTHPVENRMRQRNQASTLTHPVENRMRQRDQASTLTHPVEDRMRQRDQASTLTLPVENRVRQRDQDYRLIIPIDRDEMHAPRRASRTPNHKGVQVLSFACLKPQVRVLFVTLPNVHKYLLTLTAQCVYGRLSPHTGRPRSGS